MKLMALLVALVAAAAPEGMPRLDEPGYAKLVAGSKGKVTLVNFWATWCAPCRAEMPHLLKLEQSLSKAGFQLILVSADEPEQEALARKFLNEVKARGAAYLKVSEDDDRFIQAVDPKWSGAVPALFLYDRRGKRVRSFIGETPMKVVESEIRKLL